jgi:GNAT superfamily N-acetyltransferase
MTADDVDPAADAILADDWGDRRAWFAFAATHPACHVVVADDGRGGILGTGVATVNGPVGWIGTIWVARAARRTGLGRALTEATIDAAESAGCRTMALVATAEGRPLYERLGFRVATEYRILEAPGLGGDTDPGGGDNGGGTGRAAGAGRGTDAGHGTPILPEGAMQAERTIRARPFEPGDLDAMAALDRAATGEDRRHLLEAFASPEGTLVGTDADRVVRSFLVRAPWGGGATIAADPDAAMALLTARRLGSGPDRRIRCGVLAENRDGAARLEADGWREAWRAPRLHRGEPLAWLPDRIWGQFNHALG